MDQIARIKKMEAIMDKSEASIELLRIALINYQEIQKDLHHLSDYYKSALWQKDFRDDELQKLPPNLKRGVLSEDAIWDLLCENDECLQKMKRIIEENKML